MDKQALLSIAQSLYNKFGFSMNDMLILDIEIVCSGIVGTYIHRNIFIYIYQTNTKILTG